MKRYTFKDKWGKPVADSGHTSLPNLLIDHLVDLRIGPSEFLVITCVLKYKWSDENPYPSADTLSKLSGLAPGTVRTQIRKLKKKGLIKVVFRTNKKTNAQESNGYDFTPLKKRLESYTQPTRRQASPYSKTNSQAYPQLNTKEEAVNNTQRKRRSRNCGKPTPIGEVLKHKSLVVAIK